MKILIIGGTRFLGRHLLSAALERNHEVTIFHRGHTELVTPSEVEVIHGDRDVDLHRLTGRWEVCIDTCGYHPDSVRSLAQVVGTKIDRYILISSISVYSDTSVKGVDESAPLDQLTQEQLDKANAIAASGEGSASSYGQMYGGLKALCETTAKEIMPGRVLCIRPGLIVGPYDYTDRFTYWVARIGHGGEVLVPGNPSRTIQLIDVRDLAGWIINMVEDKALGTYNATGSPGALSMEAFVNECKSVSGSDATFTWVDEEFLVEGSVKAWSEMPLWLPESVASFAGFMFVSIDQAVAKGLKFRSLNETIGDTLSWFKAERTIESLTAGIDRERERLLLEKRHARP